MADAFPKLEFTKDWKNPTDFPTVEESEEQVRADLQLLHSETQKYINTDLAAFLAKGAENLGAVPTTRKVNGKALGQDITLGASDVGAVPDSRTVNGKQLSANITLAASDVGAVPTTRTVNGKALSANITLAASDVGAVPTTRTVNGKALSANITLAASDVGAAASSHSHGAGDITSGTLPIARGGTGKTTKADALAALASAGTGISISNGTISCTVTGSNNVKTGSYTGNGSSTKEIAVTSGSTVPVGLLIAERDGDTPPLVLVYGVTHAYVPFTDGTGNQWADVTWAANSVKLVGTKSAQGFNTSGHYYKYVALVV